MSLHDRNRRVPLAIVGGASTLLLLIGPTAAIGSVEPPTPLEVVPAAGPTDTPEAAPAPGPTASPEQVAPPEQTVDAALTVDDSAEQAPAGFVPGGPVVESVGPVAAARTDGDEPARTTDSAGADASIVLAGRGNGHGIGMSQYGTRGQADGGRTASQILRHYFQGSSVSRSSVNFEPRIGVLLDSSATRLVVRGGSAMVRFGGKSRTSRPGDVWEVRVIGSTGACRVTAPGGYSFDGKPGASRCITADPLADDASARIEVQRPTGGRFVRDTQYGREARVQVAPDRVSGTWRVDVVVELPLEQYLYGLAEMPYSWDMDALRTQAIAGRSYALWRLKQVGDDPAVLDARGCDCHLYDSQQDQVYAGWDREQTASWSRWRQAVDNTARQVVTAPGEIGTVGGIVQTFYSSSSNGRTESKHELWGGTPYPYLTSVDDRWALAPGTGNPHRSWLQELTRSSVASRVGLDRLDSVEVAQRSASGATRQVRFRGVDGGRRTTVTASGSWMRSSFGLRSTTFAPIDGDDFVDIGGSPHEDDIRWIAAREITTGCGAGGALFCPTDTVTRGQMAAFIKRAFSLPDGRRVFADTDGHLFEADIAALADAGITSGCGGNRFCPDAAVTRAEMAAFLARAKSLPQTSRATFKDSRTHLHSRAIEAVRRDGITYGCNPPDNTRFCPWLDVTRGEMASFLRRALKR